MLTLVLSVAFGAVVSALIILLCKRFSSEERKAPMFSRICVFTAVFFLFGLVTAAKTIREAIPLREKVIGVTALGATHNADGTQSFIIESREWYQHSYRFFQRTAEGTLVIWNLEGDQPIFIVEDPSLVKEGSLTIWERERDPSSHLMKWALFTEIDRQITKHVFRVPPGTVVHHVRK